MHRAAAPPEIGVYVYCVAHAEPFTSGRARFHMPAIGGQGGLVRTISYGDLVAITSNSPKIRYTLRREYLEAHEHVVEEAMTCSDVLPVTFGTVADNDEQVRDGLLKRRVDELHRYLEYVRNRVELDLKAHRVQDALFAEVVADDPQIQSLRESIARLPAEATYHERIELGELTQAAIRAKSEREAQSIVDTLELLAVESKVNERLTDMMILNAAFLVDKAQESTFDECVRSLGASEAGRFHLQYVGPVPPYNFVTLRVRWEE